MAVKPTNKALKEAFRLACRKLVQVTENCPNDLFSADLGGCGKCETGNFPDVIERESRCMEEYYLLEASKALKETPKDAEKPAEDGKDKESEDLFTKKDN